MLSSSFDILSLKMSHGYNHMTPKPKNWSSATVAPRNKFKVKKLERNSSRRRFTIKKISTIKTHYKHILRRLCVAWECTRSFNQSFKVAITEQNMTHFLPSDFPTSGFCLFRYFNKALPIIKYDGLEEVKLAVFSFIASKDKSY